MLDLISDAISDAAVLNVVDVGSVSFGKLFRSFLAFESENDVEQMSAVLSTSGRIKSLYSFGLHKLDDVDGIFKSRSWSVVLSHSLIHLDVCDASIKLEAVCR